MGVIPSFQGGNQGARDFRGGALSLESAVDMDEAADALGFESLRLRLEVAEPGGTVGCHDEDGVEVPWRGQKFLGSKDAIGLKACADLALAGLEVAQGVVGVDCIDVNAEAELRLVDRPGARGD